MIGIEKQNAHVPGAFPGWRNSVGKRIRRPERLRQTLRQEILDRPTGDEEIVRRGDAVGAQKMLREGEAVEGGDMGIVPRAIERIRTAARVVDDGRERTEAV